MSDSSDKPDLSDRVAMPARTRVAVGGAREVTEAMFSSVDRAKKIRGTIIAGVLLLGLSVALIAVTAMVAWAFIAGWSRLSINLFTNVPSVVNPDNAGYRTAILGTLYIIGGVIVLIVPLGVGAAVYLEQFANPANRFNRFIDLNIQNLAGVPSIVFGILGLAFIVRGPLDLGFVAAAGSLTLALLVLPTVILASREALRAVPSSIRDGSLALGATVWQAVSRQVLPAALPGILTGVILAVSRAIGEAAPLHASDHDLQLRIPPPGVPADPRGRRCRRHARVAHHDQFCGDLPAQSIREDLVMSETAQSPPVIPIARAVQDRVNPVETDSANTFDLQNVRVYYGDMLAVKDVSMGIHHNQITAFIGPSGCGKSTLLRSLNRMNDLIPGARVEGDVLYHGIDVYGPKVDPVQVRNVIGMVFQKPNPFPKSIYDNVAFGPRLQGRKKNLDDIVEEALRGAALWDEVKDRLKDNAYGMSGGQQQRLCIARCIAVQPDVILMDEPCSALDPVSTGRIEDLMVELKKTYTIVIVTHNMQQAARVADMTAFFTVSANDETGSRTGMLVEYASTSKIFSDPVDTRTENYVSGRFG